MWGTTIRTASPEGLVGATVKDDRLIVDAVAYCCWGATLGRDLSDGFGNWKTVRSRHTRWTEKRVRHGKWATVFPGERNYDIAGPMTTHPN